MGDTFPVADSSAREFANRMFIGQTGSSPGLSFDLPAQSLKALLLIFFYRLAYQVYKKTSLSVKLHLASSTRGRHQHRLGIICYYAANQSPGSVPMNNSLLRGSFIPLFRRGIHPPWTNKPLIGALVREDWVGNTSGTGRLLSAHSRRIDVIEQSRLQS
ncbi:hypothetical protein CCACVL1_23502 [Corchorus capsularis]|uniref:Uncharacterized protein n=1 Tax=Corchorus capsularis TaxID=210143 RepID=A0A1R3GTY4_COCAP|nr:hypothetical protein CCACVL1_23502 [Corchorus capsularis]